MGASGDGRSWHELDAAATLARLRSSEAGLTEEAARLALERHGSNELPRAKADGSVVLFLRQLTQPLIYVLLGAAAVTATLGHWIDATVILGVVIANAVIGVVQERRAGRAIGALLDLVAHESTVVRGGVARIAQARELVPGDVVVLDAGDKVPADCRLLGARGLFVDEALLTGEAVPVEKLEAGPLPADTPLPERRNLAYAGTLVTAGQGRAVVTATAEDDRARAHLPARRRGRAVDDTADAQDRGVQPHADVRDPRSRRSHLRACIAARVRDARARSWRRWRLPSRRYPRGCRRS